MKNNGFRRKPRKRHLNSAVITNFRKFRDLSMQELADMLQVSVSSVWGWEVKGRFPRKPFLEKLEQLLGERLEI